MPKFIEIRDRFIIDIEKIIAVCSTTVECVDDYTFSIDENEFEKLRIELLNIKTKVNFMDMPILEVLSKNSIIARFDNNGTSLVRITNCLRNEFYKEQDITVKELSLLSNNHFLRIPNFGQSSLKTLKKIIKYCEDNKV